VTTLIPGDAELPIGQNGRFSLPWRRWAEAITRAVNAGNTGTTALAAQVAAVAASVAAIPAPVAIRGTNGVYVEGSLTHGPVTIGYTATAAGDGGILIQGGSTSLDSALAVGFSVDGIAAAGSDLTDWELWVSPAGSLTLDIRKDVFGSIPPTVGDSIVAAAPPSVTAGTTNSSSALTGWTTSIARSDALSVVITANTGVKWFSLLLKGTRT
jgi:hypothetical protein